MRRVLSFDVDGVIANLGFIPIMERTKESYLDADLIDENIPDILRTLGYENDIYFVSSRSFKDATRWTAEWLCGKEIYGMGVMCNVVPQRKAQMINLLHATYHFDDDPQIVRSCGERGVLVEVPMVGQRTCRVGGWWPRKVTKWGQVVGMVEGLPPLHIAYAPQQGELFV